MIFCVFICVSIHHFNTEHYQSANFHELDERYSNGAQHNAAQDLSNALPPPPSPHLISLFDYFLRYICRSCTPYSRTLYKAPCVLISLFTVADFCARSICLLFLFNRRSSNFIQVPGTRLRIQLDRWG